MKLTMIVAMIFGAAASLAALNEPAAYFGSLDAPPEAIVVGVGLLATAAALRHTRHSR